MLRLIRKYPQLLLFGMLTAAFSGPGQTFLVSLFIPEMRASFGMSQGQIASLYAAATVCSACLLPWVGRLLDRIHLTVFTLIAGFLLAAGCVLLGFSQGTVSVLVGFLLIRNLGQGTLTMISSTTMARIFGRMRGRALSISNLGYPLSEAIFPYCITTWMMLYGWRSAWLMLAALILLFFSPAVLFLLRKDPHKKAKHHIDRGEELEHEVSRDLSPTVDWHVKDIVKDWQFWALLYPMLMPPGVLTALFFHQASLASAKGWGLPLVSIAFVAYAVTRGLASLTIGPLIDRFGARTLYPFTLVPLSLGLSGFIWGQHPFWAFFYLAGAGITMGIGMTITGALWAELYGTKYLGSIKGLTSSMIVFSTAISPPIVGALLDSGMNVPAILFGMLLMVAVGVIVASVICQLVQTRRSS